MSRTLAVPSDIHIELVAGGLRIDLPAQASEGRRRRHRVSGDEGEGGSSTGRAGSSGIGKGKTQGDGENRAGSAAESATGSAGVEGSEQTVASPVSNAALHRNDGAPICTVVLPAYLPGSAESRELLRRLESSPLILAGLLEEGAEALDALLPEQPPWRRPRTSAGLAGKGGTGARVGAGAEAVAGERIDASVEAQAAGSGREPEPAVPGDAGPACSCGAPGCGHVERAMAYGDAAWAADACLRLALLGWTPETLAAAALDRWAALQPLPDPDEALRQAAGGPEPAPRSGAGDGPNIAEWLAELAGQGRLHQPGPQFHDVKAALRELRVPAAAGDPATPPKGRPRAVEPGRREPGPDSAPWAALLPGVFGAAKGLALVAGRVMERAAELAAAQQNKPPR